MNNLKVTILVGYLLLAVLGILMLSSINPERLAQQALLVFVGGGVMLYLGKQDLSIFRNFGVLLYVVAIILLLSTFIFGDVVRGSVRWIDLWGFRLQTSELVKPLLIVSFAYFLEKYSARTWRGLGINLALFLLPTLLIFRQPDLGTALVISSIWLVMLFVSGVSYWMVALGSLIFSVLAYFSPHFLKSYQLERLRTFFDPYQDPLGSGYNVIQAIIAVGSGQIFGLGLGNGTQSHLRFLPERHTDFMFASLAEELGMVGALSVIIIFAVILYGLLSALLNKIPLYYQLVLAGVFGYLFFQVVINIGMNLGIAPVTGVTLPLISYGGSSALATGVIFGLALAAVSRAHSTSVLEIK